MYLFCQSEVQVSFELPRDPSVFGVVVLGGSPGVAPPDGLYFFVNTTGRRASTDGTYDVTVGATPADPRAKPAPKQHHQPLPFPRLSTLRLGPADTNLTMTLFVDHTVVRSRIGCDCLGSGILIGAIRVAGGVLLPRRADRDVRGVDAPIGRAHWRRRLRERSDQKRECFSAASGGVADGLYLGLK
jgi:hypothetical protein